MWNSHESGWYLYAEPSALRRSKRNARSVRKNGCSYPDVRYSQVSCGTTWSMSVTKTQAPRAFDTAMFVATRCDQGMCGGGMRRMVTSEFVCGYLCARGYVAGSSLA